MHRMRSIAMAVPLVLVALPTFLLGCASMETRGYTAQPK